MAKTDPPPQTFEAALAELESILSTMEDGQLPLADTLAAYKRGAELLQFCQAALKDAQQQVQVLERGVLQGLHAGRTGLRRWSARVRRGRIRCILTSRWAVWSSERARRVEGVIDGLLPPADEPPQSLHEAMRYAVLGGGKRVRALLAYAAGELADADPARVDYRPRRSS